MKISKDELEYYGITEDKFKYYIENRMCGACRHFRPWREAGLCSMGEEYIEIVHKDDECMYQKFEVRNGGDGHGILDRQKRV